MAGHKKNAALTDLNRDAMVQFQPESEIHSMIAGKWAPSVMSDLHGYMNLEGEEILIEPPTGPHNPNYESDLIYKLSLEEAEYMEKAIEEKTYLPVEIPYRDFEEGYLDDATELLSSYSSMVYTPLPRLWSVDVASVKNDITIKSTEIKIQI
ncbi:hypothetical protein [Romboutsia sp.]|uniref:hypothetical protein n=1 Tax=Romboutsia sp. TaxID=1965302 RepID=UPI003F31B470